MAGARVKVAENANATSCHPISGIEAEAATREKAEILLRNKAGEMSANAVLITETIVNDGVVRLTGEALGCKAEPTGPAEQGS